jgi:hypothetical protein
MMCSQYLSLALLGQMQVDLSRGDAAVAQEILDIFDVDAGLQQECGEGMSEDMRRDAFTYSGSFGVFIYQVADSLGA